MNAAQKVDVRGVIRAVIAELRADGNSGHVQNLLDADAAVFKLIEATRELIDFAEPQLRNYGFAYMGKFEQARTALANVGGAK